MNRFSWYYEGVHFGCTQCGRCCTGGPGAVWLNEKEPQAIADHLEISLDLFIDRYTRLMDGKLALKELGRDFDCIFLKDKKACTIYPVRPLQCQTFPYWPGIMASKEQWESAGEHCEGIRADAPLVSREVIEEQLARHNK